MEVRSLIDLNSVVKKNVLWTDRQTIQRTDRQTNQQTDQLTVGQTLISNYVFVTKNPTEWLIDYRVVPKASFNIFHFPQLAYAPKDTSILARDASEDKQTDKQKTMESLKCTILKPTSFPPVVKKWCEGSILQQLLVDLRSWKSASPEESPNSLIPEITIWRKQQKIPSIRIG